MNIGVIDTLDRVKYGKNKYKIISFVDSKISFVNYKGKHSGKIIVLYKDDKIVESLGKLSKDLLDISLQYIYNVKRSQLYSFINLYKIPEQSLGKVFSIDPENSMDIDDAISFTDNKICIYIAQPHYFLRIQDILERSKKATSTLYGINDIYHLWGNIVTTESSFIEGKLRPAICIEYTIENNKIINIIDYKTSIVNNIQTSYEKCTEYNIITDFIQITKNISLHEHIDAHDVVSFWMIKTNEYIGNKYNNLIYRNVEESIDKLINDFYPITDTKIKQIFLSKTFDKSIYSVNKDTTYHKYLNIRNYVHFTSPIRRIVDTINNYCVFHNIGIDSLDINIENLNIIDKLTKKYHKNIEINKIVEKYKNIESMNEDGYLYSKKGNYWKIYFDKIGFMSVKMWDMKFNDIIKNTDHIKPGDKINFYIKFKKGFLPKEEIFFIPNLLLI